MIYAETESLISFSDWVGTRNKVHSCCSFQRLVLGLSVGEEEEAGWGADEELGAACRSQVQRQMCSEITLGKGAASGAHCSGSKSSVQLPGPSDVLQGSVSGTRWGHFSTRNKWYFYCRQRSYLQKQSRSSISIVVQRHCFTCFNVRYPFYCAFLELNRGAPVISLVSGLGFGCVCVWPGKGGQHLQSSDGLELSPTALSPTETLCF